MYIYFSIYSLTFDPSVGSPKIQPKLGFVCFLHPFLVAGHIRVALVPEEADGGVLPEGAGRRRGRLSKRKEIGFGGGKWPGKQTQY